LNRVLLSLLLDFINVLPFEVYVRQSATYLLSQLDPLIFSIILSTLHTEACENKALGVLLDLLWL